MPPPQLFHPEWFLKEIVNEKIMRELGERINKFYGNLFEEMVYRAHHNSIKITYVDIFYSDFRNYITTACGLKKNFWKYLPESSTLKYMHERRKRFFKYLRKPREARKHHMFGDIRWSLDFWLSQLSFWYTSIKSFYNVWCRVVYYDYKIPLTVNWEEGIVLHIIHNFISCFKNGKEKCVKKKWIKKYEQYIMVEREELRRIGPSNPPI